MRPHCGRWALVKIVCRELCMLVAAAIQRAIQLLCLAGFSLNGELLMDSMGSETAFTDIQGEDFVPAFTLGVGQRARLIFGQDVNTLKYFTSCGLQEGYEPFCV